MLNSLMKHKLKIEITSFLEECTYFLDPSLSFILTKEGKAGHENIYGVHENASDQDFLVLEAYDHLQILSYDKVKYPKGMNQCDEPHIEYYIFHSINKGFSLIYMTIEFHARMWDFVDEFIYHFKDMEKGLYDYLLFCEETGVNNKTLLSYSDYPCITDIINHFYQVEYKNYGVILYQPIANQYLLLGTNFDEDQTRYYAVLLLNSKHEIVEKNHHSKLESAINDFNKLFYDLKIKEHKECEKHIQHCIQEHTDFLKERDEEIQ